MTEEKARYYAQALAQSMGITFYVVRNSEGRFLAVQIPSEGYEIVATVTPPVRGPTLRANKAGGVEGRRKTERNPVPV